MRRRYGDHSISLLLSYLRHLRVSSLPSLPSRFALLVPSLLPGCIHVFLLCGFLPLCAFFFGSAWLALLAAPSG